MSWRKYFRVAKLGNNVSPISGSINKQNDFGFRNYQSNLPDVYSGHPNRVERYGQYETMDSDSEINACLDIIAEFSTQIEETNDTAFNIQYHQKPTDNEVNILSQQLKQWVKLNKFDKRIFKIFRNTIKYGDQVFIRDPETFELFWVEPSKVSRVIVNESKGKEPEQYVLEDINPNFENLTVATKATSDFQVQPPGGGMTPAANYNTPNTNTSTTSRFATNNTDTAIDAKNIVHLSLSEGLDYFWPFGQSILEQIFKVFKQKELLEDAILIYRIQRAPERRVFKIDVGNMPSHLAMGFVERIKNEIHQRRIPTQNGGGQNMLDAGYNPLCIDLSTEIPLLDGRTLELNEIIDEYNNGKENWIYSADPITGEVKPGKIGWAGETRKNAEVIKIHLDNGNTITLTPDHKIPVLGKGFVEAKDLTSKDSLISFNTQLSKVSSNSSDYEQVFDHDLNDWVYTHRMVSESEEIETFIFEDIYDRYNHVIHHKDFDRFNNSPNNLCWMNKGDHIKYHSKNDFWSRISEERKNEIKLKIANTTRKNWENKSAEYKAEYYSEHSSIIKQAWVDRKKDEVKYNKYISNLSLSNKAYYQRSPEMQARLAKNMENRVSFANQELSWSPEMQARLISIVTYNDSNLNETMDIASSDEIFINAMKKANAPDKSKGHIYKINTDKLTSKKMKLMYKTYNFKNWKDFKKKLPLLNHKITRIEKLIDTMDTGCLNVENDWHTFAIKSGIFIKNSQNEDYFFPQNAEGRGSSVETLPGGCLSLDTKIKLLDGRDLTILEIEEELKHNELWTYSCHPTTGKVVPGLISWAGITQEDATVMKITLDNGESLTCTPDHKFPIRDIGFVRADELMNGQSMIEIHSDGVSITRIETNASMPVGTLTIDDDEIYHDYHTFSLSCGIFTKNSNLNEIDDLRYFNNKMARGLRVPSSYLPSGPDDSADTTSHGDGRMGTALIQEFRFNQYCERLQNQIVTHLNDEFKLFIKWRGFNIDSGIFDLKFNNPQNFASYRQTELDSTRLGNFGGVTDIPYMSKRFALKRFLGLTEEEMVENEEMWREENINTESNDAAGSDMRGVGVGQGDFESDMGNIDAGGDMDDMDVDVGEFDSDVGGDIGGDIEI